MKHVSDPPETEPAGETEAVGIRTPLTDFPRNDKDDKGPDIATPIDIYYSESIQY